MMLVDRHGLEVMYFVVDFRVDSSLSASHCLTPFSHEPSRARNSWRLSQGNGRPVVWGRKLILDP